MATSCFLVHCGELECELDASILEFIPAMATYVAMATLPLLLYWFLFLWFLSCSLFSCTIGSSET